MQVLFLHFSFLLSIFNIYNIIILFHYTARPIAPDTDTSACTYYKYKQNNSQYCLVSTRIDVNDVLNNNKNTEVSYVSLTVSSKCGHDDSEIILSQNFSISPTTEIGNLNATFSYKCSTNNISVRINMTVFDKCGQRSELETQPCHSISSGTSH